MLSSLLSNHSIAQKPNAQWPFSYCFLLVLWAKYGQTQIQHQRKSNGVCYADTESYDCCISNISPSRVEWSPEWAEFGIAAEQANSLVELYENELGQIPFTCLPQPAWGSKVPITLDMGLLSILQPFNMQAHFSLCLQGDFCHLQQPSLCNSYTDL